MIPAASNSLSLGCGGEDLKSDADGAREAAAEVRAASRAGRLYGLQSAQSPAEVPGRGSYSGLAGTAWETGDGLSAKKRL